MAQDSRSWGWNFGLAGFLLIGGAITLTGCFAIAFSGNPALAQITPDGSLGAENSVVTPNVSIGGLPADRIDGGATRGANLFHSFLEFNVGNGQRVYFVNPTGIENILSRVTGNNLSNIFGTLGVNGGANLFLLNPNGIIFGPNARLDIAGSFVASTADSVVFENGTKFSATNPEAPPLLTINLTPGLQYGTNQPRTTIANSGSLAVGKDLTLSAGNLDLLGQLQSGGDLTLFAQDTLRVRDSLASPFIAAAGGQLLVQGNQGVDIFALNHPNSGLFSGGDMVLRSANTVGGDAHYSSGGSFRIEQLDGGLGSLYSPNDPIIASDGDVAIGSYTGASLHIFAGGSVFIPGIVWITGADPVTGWTETVTLSNGDPVSIDGQSQPTLDVRAGINWATLPGNITIGTIAPPPVFGNSATSADITIGNIITDMVGGNGGIVLLTNQYQPNASLEGQIRLGGIDPRDLSGGGSVFIDSRNGITLTGEIDNSLDLNNTGSGRAGNVTLLAVGDISLTNGSKIISTSDNDDTSTNYSVITLQSTEGSVLLNQATLSTTNLGSGYAGDISISAVDNVSIENQSSIFSMGNSGLIFIGESEKYSSFSPRIVTIDNATISTTNSGSTFAGDISINATDQVSIENQASIFSMGNFGRIFIGAFKNHSSVSPRVVTIDNATLNTDNSSFTGEGKINAGIISVQAHDVVSLANGSEVSSSTWREGDAGAVSLQTNGGLVYLDNSRIFSNVESGGIGNGGNIDIHSGSISLLNGSQLQTLVREPSDTLQSGRGNGGEITIQAGSVYLADGAQLNADMYGQGNAGSLSVAASNFIFLIGRSSISSDTHGQGNAGTVSVQADGLISLTSGSYISSATLSEFVGNAGEVSVSAGTLTLDSGSSIYSNTEGQGDAGNISVLVDGLLSLTDSSSISSEVLSEAVGNAGEVSVVSGKLTLDSESYIASDTHGHGNADNISVQVDGLLSLTGNSYVSSDRWNNFVGNAGNLSIVAGTLTLGDGSYISSDTFGQGNAGQISVKTDNSISLTGRSSISSIVDSSAVGKGGNIIISGESFVLEDGAYVATTTAGQAGVNGRADAGSIEVNVTDSVLARTGAAILSDTVGQGDAGNVTIQAGNFVSLDGVALIDGLPFTSRISSGVGFDADNGLVGEGEGGNITITTGLLFVSNGAGLNTSTFGHGNAGNIIIRASDTVSFDGAGSEAISEVEGKLQGAVGTGNAGSINIQARSLSLTGGAEIKAQTWGMGNAGDIQVNTSDSVTLSGVAPPVLGDGSLGGYSSGLFTSTEQGASGEGGNISVTTPNLRISDGAVLSARSQSDFIGGNITIGANTLELTGGGQILTTAFSNGAAGDITVNSAERVTISGSDPTFVDRLNQVDQARIVIDPVGAESGLFANTVPGSTGKGGSIFMNSNQVAISNGAKVAVDSQGQGNGGNITIQANSLTLDDRASIVAQTASGEGGNLTLQVNDILLMRHNSLLSAEAGGTGNGGNIDIDADFVVAVPKENSDIVANAYQGRGGNINITTQGIYGLEYRQNRTPLSDITASSQFGVNGVVSINTPNVDPRQGLVPLPSDVVHTEGLIDRHCTPGRGTDHRSSFTVTGRGGLPPSPNDPLRGETVIANWVTLDSEDENRNRTDSHPNPTTTTPNQLVEAQGWVIGSDGQVILTAQTPTVTPQTTELKSPSCQDFQTDTP